MREILEAVTAWTARGDAVALATVVDVVRSAPRQPGAKLAVSASGAVAGAVSGGCVEAAVVEVAEEILAGAPPRLLSYAGDDDPCAVGLPCGGGISIWVQAYVPGRLAEMATAGLRGAEVTLLEGANAGAKLVIEADGARRGTLGSPELDRLAETEGGARLWTELSGRRGPLFIDVTAPAPRLVIVGAVDVAASLCTIARTCGWRAYVVDPRARFAARTRFRDAEEVVTSWPEAAFSRLGPIDPNTSIVVLTHDPKLDDAALVPALTSPAQFVGAMGSRAAQTARRERLRQHGVTEAELERLSAPVGLDLGATSPSETALSIFAEVVAARHARRGGRLRDTAGRIHALTR